MANKKYRLGHKHGVERSVRWVTENDLFASDEFEPKAKAKTKNEIKKCAKCGATFKRSNRFYASGKHVCQNKAKQTAEQLKRAEEEMEKALVKAMKKLELKRAKY